VEEFLGALRETWWQWRDDVVIASADLAHVGRSSETHGR